MELFLLYLWLKIDTVRSLLVGTMVLLLPFGIAVPWCHDFAGEAFPAAVKWFRRVAIFAVSSLVLSSLLPSKTDIAILVGASVALDMAKSPEGVKVGTLLRGKVNEVLDEAIKEMTPKPAPAK